MGHEHTYMVELYSNPNNVSQPSPVVGFHEIPQVKNDLLTGYVMKPNRDSGIPSNAVVMYNGNIDCSDPTHVSIPAPVPNAISAPVPVYNQCAQLIGYIGSVVKNSAGTIPTSPVLMML